MTNMYAFKRVAVLIAALFLVIAAAFINSAALYYMASLLVALPVVSYLIGMVSLRGLEFDREVPESGWEGESTTITLVVKSVSKFHRLFLEARDHLPVWLKYTSKLPIVFSASPNSETRIPIGVDLLKRGCHAIESVSICAIDPLGIFSFVKSYPVHSVITVYPTPQPFPDMVLSGTERYGFREMPFAATRGNGIDPDGVREYVPGDPLRRVHWRSTAKTQKLSVVEFEESRSINIVMALDLRRNGLVGEGLQTTLEYMAFTTASISMNAIRHNAGVQLVTGSMTSSANSSGRGTEHLHAILNALARIEMNEEGHSAECIAEKIGILAPGTSLILISSCIDKEIAEVVLTYVLASCQVTLLHIDPLSFEAREHNWSSEEQNEMIQTCIASGAGVYIQRRNSQRTIQIETVNYVQDNNSQNTRDYAGHENN